MQEAPCARSKDAIDRSGLTLTIEITDSTNDFLRPFIVPVESYARTKVRFRYHEEN
jgi:hypothetical protein